MGFENRPPTADELARMQALLAQALEDGAVGLSTGSGISARRLRRRSTSRPRWRGLAQRGRRLLRHPPAQRGRHAGRERPGGADGRRADRASPCNSPTTSPKGARTGARCGRRWRMMAAARAAGLDVLTDQYPYTAFMTGLGVILLPKWANDGSAEETVARLRDPGTAPASSLRSRPPAGTGTPCRSASPATRRETQGLTLAQLGVREGKSPGGRRPGSAAGRGRLGRRRPLRHVRGGRRGHPARPAHHDRLRRRRQRPRTARWPRTRPTRAPTAPSPASWPATSATAR